MNHISALFWKMHVSFMLLLCMLNPILSWSQVLPAPYNLNATLTNDPWQPYDTLPNIMHILIPSYVSGVITDSISQQPLPGVEVSAAVWTTYTIGNGSYFLWLDEGAYDLRFYKAGYIDVIQLINAVAGDTLFIDVGLVPQDMGLQWAMAEVDCNDPAPAYIEWSSPEWLEEIIYDDGGAEDLFLWSTANGESAVRFTPPVYPARVFGGSLFVGDGTWPVGNWLGTNFNVFIYDANESGLPENQLASCLVTVNDFEWLEFYFQDVVIDSGSFFISMQQLNPSPIAAPLGIDLDLPLAYKSYSKPAGGNWQVSANQDFMIRTLLMYGSNDSVSTYTIARINDFDPNLGPQPGTMTILKDTFSQSFIDHDFQYQAEAWYAFAVKANYDWGASSQWVYSNIVGMDMGRIVEFQGEDCNGNPIEDIEVTMYGLDWPFALYIDPPPDTNWISDLDCVWVGWYDITISRPGYSQYEFDAYIGSDTLFPLVLNPVFYQVRNLRVDSLTNTAYWEGPLITALNEDFNGSGLPPGWQMTSNCLGWFMTLDGSSFMWTIPAWNSQYMCVNENAQGSMCSGSVDYLITPPLDLRETDNFRMEFDSYFDKKFGMQIATVEYSYDFGTSWDEIYSLTPVPDKWDHLEIDLSAFSGPYSEPGVLFAFHSNDGGSWGSGWAVDNVEILAGPANPDNYYVYLDGSVYDITDTLFYQYYELNYGQTYTACVTANYSCGPSDMLCVDFTSAYLRAPEWLIADSMGLDIVLTWFMDTMDIDEQILGYNVYRDSINVAFVLFIGEDTSYYTDVAPPPMCYDYHVSSLYDLYAYGFPGDTGESLYTGPEEVCLVYGAMLPIVEEWSSGSFGSFWTAEDNWVVNGQFGNPHPCAEFTWDPMLMDYQQCLTSGPINGVDHGTKSEPYIDGQFILNFDVSLVDNSAGGTEYFNVEVWSDGAWNRVGQLSNANGNFEWENVEVDISEYALGYIFKVRFMAEGEVSYNILSWMLDNIEIFHYCAPPKNLYADYCYPDICLEWSPPISNVAAYEWISWDDGIHFSGVGIMGGGVFSVASHWDADQITAYEGMYITKIRFVPYINAVATTFTLKVWEGPDAGTLVYEEALSSLVPGEWNDITLATPVAIDHTQELWFGYTVDSPVAENPAGRDEGPAVAGYGDMISLDGIAWDPLSQISTIDGNWNLQALIAGGDESKRELLLKNDSQKTLSDLRAESKDVIGYNIYLDKLQDEYEFVDFTEDTSYTYEYQGGSLLFFVVTTVYEDCESGYSNVACVSIGIDENDKNNVIRIFPNPASDMITVESSVRMSRLCLLDYSGRILQCHELQNQIQSSLDVSSYEPGIYLLRVDTEEGRFVRKLVVAR